VDIVSLIAEAKKHHPSFDSQWLNCVFAFASKTLEGRESVSEVPLLRHALGTAFLLAELRLDPDCLAAALLHDVIIRAGESVEKIKTQFGAPVAKLVDGATRLSLVKWGKLDKENVSSLQKMFLSMADDVRIVLIKLAEKLDYLKASKFPETVERERAAKETLFIFAPLAGKLGIWSLKREMEDLAFKHLEPVKYREIVDFLADSRENREKAIGKAASYLKHAMAEQNIPAEITGRPKHIYGIYKKMTGTQRDFSAIYDVQAVRIVVESVKDCYAALDIIHRAWTPLPEEFDDYIAKPKSNGYQSLHTAVIGLRRKPLEIQIRTQEMHRISEFGIASHWRYKDGWVQDASLNAKVNYLRILIEWQRELAESKELLQPIKGLPFAKYVYVLTPKGDILDLPVGSTPVDFAYRIHTDLGHRCRGAKVNGKLVSLDYKLKSGDRVDILTAKEKRPSRDWLNPKLGYIFTPRVKQKIRQWFRTHDREANIGRGRDILDRALRQLGIRGKNFDEIAPLFNFKKSEDLLEAVGYGEIRSPKLKTKLIRFYQDCTVKIAPDTIAPSFKETSRVWVEGEQDFLTRTAQCCRPLPGDEIVGFVTKGRGITVHRANCHNILRHRNQDRLIEVGWGQEKQLHTVRIRVDCMDAKKTLKEMAAIVKTEDSRILASNLGLRNRAPLSAINVQLEITGIVQLNRILQKIKALSSVIEVEKRNL